jgi:hypothetical protein
MACGNVYAEAFSVDDTTDFIFIVSHRQACVVITWQRAEWLTSEELEQVGRQVGAIDQQKEGVEGPGVEWVQIVDHHGCQEEEVCSGEEYKCDRYSIPAQHPLALST